MHKTMTKLRPIFVLLMLVLLALPAIAQDEDDDYPRPIAPGETILPIEELPDAATGCFPAFPLVPGDVIYIEPGGEHPQHAEPIGGHRLEHDDRQPR